MGIGASRIVTGWPGRRASLWQQAGRAGRSGEESLAVLVAADDPLDTYLVRHPEAIFGTAVEATVVDPDNPHVLAPHLAAAAAELPLGESDLELFGRRSRELLDVLVEHGILRRRPAGWFWAREDRPADHVSLRGTSDVVAVMLPVAALYLARPMPPARALVDAGAAIALATDFNPGSAFCESLPVVCTLACTQLGLAPEEALGACTVNAAYVLGLHDRGRSPPGYGPISS